MSKRTIGISLYLDLTGVEAGELWCPDIDEHQEFISEHGVSVFDLPPYSMTQMNSKAGKTSWYYVDTGQDGHAILGFTQAKKVLRQTMKWHQEATILQLDKSEEPES